MFSVNNRTYHPPEKPVVVICLDGSADEYLDCALARGRMPHLAKMSTQGWRGFARAAMPTFTNVNNVPNCPASDTGTVELKRTD